MCLGCRKKLTPPGALAAYEQHGDAVRSVRSQRERDLEALKLAGRRGTMLGELRRLAGDERLDDSAAMKVEWFTDEVRAARSGARLDELVELFAAEQIRPRGWFQRPVSITAGHADADGELDYDEDDEDDGPATVAGTTPVSITSRARQPTWADAIAARGWRLALPSGSPSCPVIDENGTQCTAGGTCTGFPDGYGGHAFLCQWHYGTLGRWISEQRKIA